MREKNTHIKERFEETKEYQYSYRLSRKTYNQGIKDFKLFFIYMYSYVCVVRKR